MAGGFHFGPGVRGRKRETDAPHDDHIGQIVSYIRHFVGAGFRFFENSLQERDLFDMALEHPGHAHLAGPFGGRWGIAAADDAGFDVEPGQPAERNAILGIEALGLHHFSVGARDQQKVSVGQHPIHVH